MIMLFAILGLMFVFSLYLSTLMEYYYPPESTVKLVKVNNTMMVLTALGLLAILPTLTV